MLSTTFRRCVYLISTNYSYSISTVANTSSQNPQFSSLLIQSKNPQNSVSVLSFLKEIGFSNAQLEKMVKYKKQLLSASLDNTIKPKIKIFQELGLLPCEIADILSKEPTILCCSVSSRVLPSLSVLKGILGSDSEVAKLLRRSGWFLTRDLEKSLVPNIEFLKSCGIPLNNIFSLLYKCPRILMSKPEFLRRIVEKVDGMGFDRSTLMFMFAVRVVGSLSDETWEHKLRAFRDLGFSETEIEDMFRKAPQAFAGSVEKIKRVTEVLLATGKYNLSCIVDKPMSLTCSVERRYIPRLRILGILEEDMENWPPLRSIYLLPDEKFHEKYVIPYLNESGQEYTAKNIASAKREKNL